MASCLHDYSVVICMITVVICMGNVDDIMPVSECICVCVGVWWLSAHLMLAHSYDKDPLMHEHAAV